MLVGSCFSETVKKHASHTEDRAAGVHEGVKTRLVIQ